jgi:hypothetical protein
VEFQWSAKEWLDMWQDFEVSIPEKPTGTTREHAEPFFRSRYTNPREANWKCERFLRAYRYLDTHLASFEKAFEAIGSSKRLIASPYIQVALFRFFGSVPDEKVVAEPSPEIFVKAAEEQRRGRPNP